MCSYDLPHIKQGSELVRKCWCEHRALCSLIEQSVSPRSQELADQGKAPWCPQIIIVGWSEEQKPLLSVMVPTDLRPKPVVSHPSCILGSAGEFSKNIYSPGPVLDKLTANLWALAWVFPEVLQGLVAFTEGWDPQLTEVFLILRRPWKSLSQLMQWSCSETWAVCPGQVQRAPRSPFIA